MVWIVQGHLHSRAEGNYKVFHAGLCLTPPHTFVDQVNVAGEVTSHWIRPCRTYRLGRASGYSVVAGKGQTKERALDFRIKATATPKEGAWTLVAGGEDWNVVSPGITFLRYVVFFSIAVVHHRLLKACGSFAAG